MITRIAQVEKTHDVISGLSLVQPSRGHRLSLDALLLAHFASQSTARGPVVRHRRHSASARRALRPLAGDWARGAAAPLRAGPAQRAAERARGRHLVGAGRSARGSPQDAAHLLLPRGRLCLVFPASRLSCLFAALKQSRLEPRRLLLVYPRRHQKASRVLVGAVKGAREGLEVQPPLFVHEPSGRTFTEEVAALIR